MFFYFTSIGGNVMKKLNLFLLSLLLMMEILAGCEDTSENNESNSDQEANTEQNDDADNDEAKEEAFHVTLKDASGEEVTIKEDAEQNVTIITNITKI